MHMWKIKLLVFPGIRIYVMYCTASAEKPTQLIIDRQHHVFDDLQYASMEREGLGGLVTCGAIM